MAKRMTDTEIWGKRWFRILPVKLKEAWRYLTDKCNHAGIWEIDTETMSYFIGEDITLDEIKFVFGKRLNHFCESKLFISRFITFQYNLESISDLNPENRVHKSVIKILKGYNLLTEAPSKGLIEVQEGCKDKDKNKELDKAKVKDINIINEPSVMRSIIEEWNHQGLPEANLFPATMGKVEPLLNTSKSHFTIDQILQGIKNYATVKHATDRKETKDWTRNWTFTLLEFLRKDTDRFLSEDFDLNVYLKPEHRKLILSN